MPVKPGLATILVGDDPASAVYVGSKRRTCVELGIRDLHQHLPADITQEELAALITERRRRSGGHRHPAAAAAPRAPRSAGADRADSGRTRMSTGSRSSAPDAWRAAFRACTRARRWASMELLDSLPRAICRHRRRRRRSLEPRRLAAGADAAAARRDRHQLPQGHPQPRAGLPPRRRPDRRRRRAKGLVDADYVRPGATVIDVGIHRTEDGLRGDVDFDERRSACRRADHPGPRRRRPDDDRDADAQHPARREAAGLRDGRVATRLSDSRTRISAALRGRHRAGRDSPDEWRLEAKHCAQSRKLAYQYRPEPACNCTRPWRRCGLTR